MNIQPSKPGKPDALGRLIQLWGLTPANEALARAYLMNDQADESLLCGAERQVFTLDWQNQWEIRNLLKEVTGSDYKKNQAKVLRLLWAIGLSTAGFAALFDDHYENDPDTVSDSAYRQRVGALGQAAAAAMDAEHFAAFPAGDIQTEHLHQLARTDPAVLLEAQRFIADPKNSLADGVLAGVLLANTDPVEEKSGLLGKLLGTASRRAKSGSQLERQVELLLAWVDAIVEGTAGSGFSSVDIRELKSYIHAGDPTLPMPVTLAAWKQQLEDYEIIQSIDQLSRPIYRLPAEQDQASALETVAGRILNSLSLMGKLQGMGWYRGSVVDGGGFYTFYREDPSVGIGVELNFSGSFVGGDNEDVTVFDAVFYKAGTVERGSYCYDAPKKENIFPLGQVPARYYSEVVWQLERATASSKETDPDWRRKKN